MFMAKLSIILSLLAWSSILQALAYPISRNFALHRRAAGGSRFVVYQDFNIPGIVGPPPVEQLTGFTHYILCFWLPDGPRDQVQAFFRMTPDQRAAIKKSYNDAGIKLMISAFGETSKPTSEGLDPAKTANDFADFALQLGVDGVDVDYEDLDAMNKKDGTAETWLTTFTNTLRLKLPSGQFEISHAPLGPWFSPVFTSGAYVAVEKNTNNAIDFYNIQFYNQLDDYTTCDGLFNVGPADFPKSAVFEIAAQGVPIEKLVVGKPGTTQDITRGGFIDPATLGGCLADAKAKGFNAGAMAFQFPHADAAWVKAVRGSAFLAGGSTTPALPVAPAPDPTVSVAPEAPSVPDAPTGPVVPSAPETSPVVTGACTDPAWDATTQFFQGTKVSFQGHSFTAAFFSQGTQPGDAVACQDGTIACKPWTDHGPC